MNDPRRATALNRLLGPGRPEVSCEVCFQQLDRYVELELAGAGADRFLPGMSAHLEGCPACAEERATLIALLTDPTGSDPRSTPWPC